MSDELEKKLLEILRNYEWDVIWGGSDDKPRFLEDDAKAAILAAVLAEIEKLPHVDIWSKFEHDLTFIDLADIRQVLGVNRD